MDRKRLVAATVAAAVLALGVGGGIAYAEGGPHGLAGGANIERAKNVALDHVNGRVTDTEVGDEEGYYEVEVTKDDGSQVDVHLDKDFEVLSTPADREDSENEDSSGDN